MPLHQEQRCIEREHGNTVGFTKSTGPTTAVLLHWGTCYLLIGKGCLLAHLGCFQSGSNSLAWSVESQLLSSHSFYMRKHGYWNWNSTINVENHKFIVKQNVFSCSYFIFLILYQPTKPGYNQSRRLQAYLA